MYYQQNLMYYIQNLYSQLQASEQKISRLEESVQELRATVEELRNRPYTNIERIEYNFDQLKVETLEGTLNIGVNPANGESIQNFEVSQQQPPQVPVMEAEFQAHVLNQARDQVEDYLENETDSLFDSLEAAYDTEFNQQYREMILTDISRQIDSRISYHHSALPLRDTNQTDEHIKMIANNVKTDIENSINHFVRNLPK
ncbi:spore gernimation protein GerPC [Bacillus lacus]|uniref:Spore gernimation protein GerPC n=1 Tax=Metabacillus lacus TaxID=1983721 RepID=A0A7X2J137_9BACI|nr:spore germination protein GerPC [Metabacillus lacus]MRX73517.1 spore gernimation protein GerPC [Metabacillus lacus]